MVTNIFSEIKQKREQVKNFAKTALEKSWINQDEFQNLIQKIDNDILTIGVIGQMKAGKSTFLNAFLFGKEVLPSATTPMTAALSVITYGEEKAIEIEFYTQKEWEEMKLNASRNIESAGGDKVIESKIKSAKELVEKSERIGSALNSILGTQKKDSLDNLIEYVGADGKYVAITKSVTIYYPEDWLKGVRVVDTPGFNDPIVSREERTQEFLKEADAVVLLVYAGRAFDATDREILFDKVRKVGIGKVLIGINKYDIQYGQGETIEEITNNVKEEIKKACKDQDDETIKELLGNIEPIPFSANMSLMAKMPMDKIQSDEQVKFYWNKACDDFEISSQKEMLEKSLVKKLENAIKETIEHSKAEILLRKPIHQIISKGTEKLHTIEAKLTNDTNELKILSESDEDWEAKLKDIERAEKRINFAIENNIAELFNNVEDIIKKTYRRLEDDKDNTVKQMHKEIEDANRFTGEGKTLRKLEALDEDMRKRLIRDTEDEEERIKADIKDRTNKICLEIEDYLRRYFKDDYEDILKKYQYAMGNLRYNEDDDEEDTDNYHNEQETPYTLLDGINDFLDGLTFGLKGKLLAEWKDEYRYLVDKNVKNNDIVRLLIQELEKRTDFYLSRFDEDSAKHILSDLREKREEYRGKEEERLAKIAALEKVVAEQSQEKAIISEEVAEMKNISKKII